MGVVMAKSPLPVPANLTHIFDATSQRRGAQSSSRDAIPSDALFGRTRMYFDQRSPGGFGVAGRSSHRRGFLTPPRRRRMSSEFRLGNRS